MLKLAVVQLRVGSPESTVRTESGFTPIHLSRIVP